MSGKGRFRVFWFSSFLSSTDVYTKGTARLKCFPKRRVSQGGAFIVLPQMPNCKKESALNWRVSLQSFSLPEVMDFSHFWEEHFSVKQKCRPFIGQSTQDVSL